MIRKTLLLLALLAPLTFAQENEAGFIPIFNGKDLSDWDGVPGAWKVEDGAIVCTGKKTGDKNWLIWKGGEPADFELRLEFKYTAGNSGVQIRSHRMDDVPYHVQGYQVEIAASNVMGLWHHSLAPEKSRSYLALAGQHSTFDAEGTNIIKSIGDGEAIKKLCKDGEWNKLTIIAKGDTLTQIINGKVFSILTDNDAKYAMSKGLIALQDHGKGTIAAFRKLRIKGLE